MQPRPPLFILCTMRSYSSLVCAMLGQHPDLYGVPELNLMVANTVDGVLTAYARRPHGLHGLLRTIAEIKFGGQNEETIDAALAWVRRRADWSGRRMYRHIMAGVAPRQIVDKSPVAAREIRFLRRLLDWFPEASYLHLTRHPRPCGCSIQRMHERIDAKMGTLRVETVDPEMVWLRTNHNILKFKAMLAPGQYMHLQGEVLLQDPKGYLPQLAEWLGIRMDADALEAVLHPETSPYACPGPTNAVFGNDPDFLSNPCFQLRPIPTASLVGPMDWCAEEDPTFSRQTLKLARQLGYQ